MHSRAEQKVREKAGCQQHRKWGSGGRRLTAAGALPVHSARETPQVRPRPTVAEGSLGTSMHTPAHTCTCMHTPAHIHLPMPAHECTCAHTYTCLHIPAHGCTHLHIYTCTHICMHTYTCARTCTHTYLYSQAHAHMHTPVHMHMPAHACTAWAV